MRCVPFRLASSTQHSVLEFVREAAGAVLCHESLRVHPRDVQHLLTHSPAEGCQRFSTLWPRTVLDTFLCAQVFSVFKGTRSGIVGS